MNIGQATIVLSDQLNGGVHLQISYDPDFNVSFNNEPSTAQRVAKRLAELIEKELEESE